MIEGNGVRERRANLYPRKLIRASRENTPVFINLAFGRHDFLRRGSLGEADQPGLA